MIARTKPTHTTRPSVRSKATGSAKDVIEGRANEPTRAKSSAARGGGRRKTASPVASASAAKKPVKTTRSPAGAARSRTKGRTTVADEVVLDVFGKLTAAYPDAHCELIHRNVFELLIATVLSAQSTDVAVNKLTPALFARWPDAASLARANVAEVESAIATIGMFRQKAKRLVELSKLLMSRHGGEVPDRMEQLIELPGVGRKTANVVLGVWFKRPVGVVVDTHVQRLTQRLGWTLRQTPEEIEQDLLRVIPPSSWDQVAHVLIFHGRRTCDARKPACGSCSVRDHCPSAFAAVDVGRKPPRVR